MDWMGIASIVFVCVTMNHLGLIGEIEEIIGKQLPIVNCPKCSSFWATLVYCCYVAATDVTGVLAISFAASYAALWLELAEGFVDTLYLKLYGKIYSTAADTTASGASEGDTAGSVSELQQNN